MPGIMIGLNDKSTHISDVTIPSYMAAYTGGASEVPYIRIMQTQNNWEVLLKLNSGDSQVCTIRISDDPHEVKIENVILRADQWTTITVSRQQMRPTNAAWLRISGYGIDGALFKLNLV